MNRNSRTAGPRHHKPGDDDSAIRVVGPRLHCGAICGDILRALPAWFGIPAAIADYEQAVDQLPTLLAEAPGSTVGLLSIKQHNRYTAEHYVLGVRREWHRQGIGRALVMDLESRVRDRGCTTLMLGTDDEDNMTTLAGVDLYPDIWEHIANIKNLRGHPYGFYQKMGFVIVGVLPDANGPGKPDILMAKRVTS